MSEKVVGIWHLNNPAHCRDFIKSCRMDFGMGEKPVTVIYTEDGVQHEVDDLTDRQAIAFAAQFAEWMELKAKKA